MMNPLSPFFPGIRLPKGPTPNRYRPHYTGKRGIAAKRNRRKIESGQIPSSQVLRNSA